MLMFLKMKNKIKKKEFITKNNITKCIKEINNKYKQVLIRINYLQIDTKTNKLNS